MAVLQSSVLGLWIDLVPEKEEAFNEWYRTEHLAERVHVPGFLRGRRWVSIKPASPKYFTTYETETADVLRSEPYIRMLNNPTPASSQHMPNVRNGFRTAYAVVRQTGTQDGPCIASFRFEAEDTWALLNTLHGAVFPAVDTVPGVRSVTLCEAEPQATGIMTTERRIGGASTPTATYLLLVETAEPAVFDSDAYRAAFGPGSAFQERVSDIISGEYQLVQEYRRPRNLPADYDPRPGLRG